MRRGRKGAREQKRREKEWNGRGGEGWKKKKKREEKTSQIKEAVTVNS